MIYLPLYAKIKDRYCIGYFGPSVETLLHIKKARLIIEKALPGIEVYICCTDINHYVLKDEKRVINKSQLANNIAYLREITNEPVCKLLEESNIPYDANIFN